MWTWVTSRLLPHRRTTADPLGENCTACGRAARRVRRPVPDHDAAICDACLALLNDVLDLDTDADRAYWLTRTVHETCSFCGHEGEEVGGLVACRPPAFICRACIEQANCVGPAQ